MRLDEIFLEGPGLRGGRFWISMIDPSEHCDENRWRELDGFRGDWFSHQLSPDLADRELAEIRFSAMIRGPDCRVRLTLIRHPRAAERP
jgi:hypothetical protein